MSGHEVKEGFMPMFNATLLGNLRACGGGMQNLETTCSFFEQYPK